MLPKPSLLLPTFKTSVLLRSKLLVWFGMTQLATNTTDSKLAGDQSMEELPVPFPLAIVVQLLLDLRLPQPTPSLSLVSQALVQEPPLPPSLSLPLLIDSKELKMPTVEKLEPPSSANGTMVPPDIMISSSLSNAKEARE